MFLASNIVIGITVFFPVLALSTYILSVTSNHVEPFLPYLSGTGNYPVESCIFTSGLNVISATYILTVFLRYCQLIEEGKNFRSNCFNLTSAIFGIQGAVGLSVTGSFPQKTFNVCHGFGFILCITGTLIYMILQTAFSYTYMSDVTKNFVKISRLVLSVAAFLISSTGFILFSIYRIQHPSPYQWITPIPRKKTWTTVTGAVMEWILFFINLAFFAFFYDDFKRIALSSDKITFLTKQIQT